MASIVALSGGTTLGGSYCAAAVETNRTKVREADRKSTRLNSSQGYISYAVFCLKKKKNNANFVHPAAPFADHYARVTLDALARTSTPLPPSTGCGSRALDRLCASMRRR